MSESWHLRVTDWKGVVVEGDIEGPAMIGRQQTMQERFPDIVRAEGLTRVVIAPLEETTISRRHLEVRPTPDDTFFVMNKSENLSVRFSSGVELPTGEGGTVNAPVDAYLGGKILHLSLTDTSALSSLPTQTISPGRDVFARAFEKTVAQVDAPSITSEQLTNWIQAFLGLLQSAAGSEDFFMQAARSLVQLVKLDLGRVLFFTEGGWVERALYRAPALTPSTRAPSTRVLASVMREKKTFWQVPELNQLASVRDIDAVIAAPILNPQGDVIGALYGERSMRSKNFQSGPISLLEAMLVEVLASGVAAGLARLEQEKVALRGRMQMEQFFTSALAEKLVDHPELLQGQATEVTVLFCDVHGYSGFSEELGPAKTVAVIADVLSVLSQCVLDEDGVLVDYIGDELMAMWGAPEALPDHADCACRAALKMLDALPALNDRLREVLGKDLEVGIGINTGTAHVGNIGSNVKFKYGPIGNTVNLASRVQGATKYFKRPLLITEATHTQLASGTGIRRLGEVRVVHIAQPVLLFEVVPSSDDPHYAPLKSGYEQALNAFVAGNFNEACSILGRLLSQYPGDGPSLVLLSRAVAYLVTPPQNFDPVLILPGK